MDQQQNIKRQFEQTVDKVEQVGRLQVINQQQKNFCGWNLFQSYAYATFLKHHPWVYNREVTDLSERMTRKIANLIKTKDKKQIKKYHTQIVQKYRTIEDLIIKQQEKTQLQVNNNQILIQKLKQVAQKIASQKLNDRKEKNIEKTRIKYICNKKKRLIASLTPTQLQQFSEYMQIKQQIQYLQHHFPDPPRGLLTCSDWNYYEDYMFFTYIKLNLSKLKNNTIMKKDWYIFNKLSLLIKTKTRCDVIHHHFELIRQFQSIDCMMHYFQVQVIKHIRANPLQLRELKMCNQYIDQFIQRQKLVQGFSKDQQIKYLQNPDLLCEKIKKKQQKESIIKMQDNGQTQIIRFQTNQKPKICLADFQIVCIQDYDQNTRIINQSIQKNTMDSNKQGLVKVQQCYEFTQNYTRQAFNSSFRHPENRG